MATSTTMGVKALYYWTTSNVANDHQLIKHRIEELVPQGQVKVATKPWRVKFGLLNRNEREASSSQNTMYKVNMSDCPGQQALVLGDSVLLAAENIDIVLSKLKMFRHRFSSSIEGSEYVLGDFVVRVGSARVRDALNTVAVELEYLPCLDPRGCDGILQTFASTVGVPVKAQKVETAAMVQKAKLPLVYGPSHAALLYIAMFSNLSSQGT